MISWVRVREIASLIEVNEVRVIIWASKRESVSETLVEEARVLS